MEGYAWRQIGTFTVDGKVESLCWSVTGSILAVSFGEGETVLYKEGYDGKFEEVAKVNDTSFTEVPNNVNFGSGAQSFQQAAPVSSTDAEFLQQQQNVLEAFSMAT